MIWISFDLDWVTGDCRAFDSVKDSACIKAKLNPACQGCATGKVGRGPEGSCEDSETRWNTISDYIKSVKLSRVVVRDSHGDIFPLLNSGDLVLNFDSHTDDYGGDLVFDVSCGNWVNHCEKNEIEVRQCKSPMPITDGAQVSLFVAVSRPYTNTDYDGALFGLLFDLEMPIDLYGGP